MEMDYGIISCIPITVLRVGRRNAYKKNNREDGNCIVARCNPYT